MYEDNEKQNSCNILPRDIVHTQDTNKTFTESRARKEKRLGKEIMSIYNIKIVGLVGSMREEHEK